jgi:hypothetical protein
MNSSEKRQVQVGVDCVVSGENGHASWCIRHGYAAVVS